MKIKIRKDSRNVWSFVEEWNNKYSYNGYSVAKVLVGMRLTPEGFISVPLQLKGGEFSPLESVLENYSLEQWLASKKPIYSSLGDGLIIRFYVKYDYKTLIPDFEKSYWEVYSPVVDKATDTYVPLSRVFNLSEAIKSRIDSLMLELFSERVSRDSFLERRIYESNKNIQQLQNRS